MFASAALTHANQHQYIKQQELEHAHAIANHEQRYTLLLAELAEEKLNGFKRYNERSQTPATARVDTGMDIFEDGGLPLHSITAFIDEDNAETTNMPLFAVDHTDTDRNN
jgi:hypothetical protein